ncbi:Thiamine-monophosphate kinase [Candidatus Entotheonellaceae bacterium PAL068K]
MRVGELGEFALIAQLQSHLEKRQSPHVLHGLGDDCAVLQSSEGMELLLTTDTQEEGIHFRRDWATPEDIGWRCLAVNVSDIAAMAGRPLGAVIALSVPATLEVTFMEAFYSGLQAIASRYDCPVIGGNVSQRADTLSVTITVLGEVPSGQSVYRSGAQAGDEIWVTGDLGGAKAGLEVLRQAGTVTGLQTATVLARFRRPLPRLREAQYVRQQAPIHSLLDISDGLSSDLRHICEASGVGAQIDAASIPIAEETRRVAAALADDPLTYALHGGEDFELCCTAPPGVLAGLQDRFGRQFRCSLVRVGTIQTGAGVTLVQPDGTQQPLHAQGYDHFRPD